MSKKAPSISDWFFSFIGFALIAVFVYGMVYACILLPWPWVTDMTNPLYGMMILGLRIFGLCFGLAGTAVILFWGGPMLYNKVMDGMVSVVTWIKDPDRAKMFNSREKAPKPKITPTTF